MFPLFGSAFPTSSQELAASIAGALSQVVSFASSASPVAVTGRSFPSIDKFTIDLSGATVKLAVPPLPPKSFQDCVPGVTLGRLDVIANPIFVQQSKAQFELTASELKFDFAREARGGAMLLLTAARDGRLSASVEKSDFQSMLLAAANVAGKQQGVTIQELNVDLQSNGPRSLSIQARVKAKKMMMSGVITVRGRVDLDEQLNATLSGLSCTGEGMIGSMAAGLVQTKLTEIQGRKIPLMALSLGDVTLRDVKIQTTPALRLTAEFGS